MKFIVMAMAGAGNLGDDLISAFLSRELLKLEDCESITVLHFPFLEKGLYPDSSKIKMQPLPWVKNMSGWCSSWLMLRKELRKSSVIIVGGGGLLQDKHRPFTPYLFTRFAFSLSNLKKSAYLLGVGVGPIKHDFNKRYLKYVSERFQHIQVRDKDSKEWFNEGKGSISIAPDIVAGTSYNTGIFKKESPEEVLGCSIRDWEDLNCDDVVNLISSICLRENLTCRLFVFEYQVYSTEELEYANKISNLLSERGVSVEIITYGKDSLDFFLSSFCSVKKAIASRYHANILWQKLNIPVLPIAYAEKVTSLYEERGGKVIKHSDIKKVSENELMQEFQNLNLDDEVYYLPYMEEGNELSKMKLVKNGSVGLIFKFFQIADFGRRKIVSILN